MQIWFNGLCSGATIALLAVAFSIVFIPTGVFFIALAGIYVVSAYIALQLLRWGVPWYIASLCAVASGILISLLCDYFNHQPLMKRKSSGGAHMISSLGIYMVLVELVALIWGNEPQVLRSGIGEVVRWKNLTMAYSQITILVVSGVFLTMFMLWVNRSGLGLKFRALSDNPVQLALLGYNTDHLRLLAFGISGAMGAVAGLLNAYDLGFDPHTGMSAVMLAIVATIIGGRNSFIGPIMGGILLGFIRSQVVWHTSARWQDAVTFLILAVFLFCRPSGLSGGKGRVEAQP